FTAKATIYLGQPLSPNGTNQIQSLSTNPSAVKAVVLSPSAQHRAEQRAGLRPGALAGHVSTLAIAGTAAALGRVGQTPLVSIVVTGSRPAKIAKAANALANYQQLLTLAQNVEQSKLFSPARATKTTARSRRNSILVGALIGLVLGILAALLWEPAVRVARRTSV